MISVSVCVGRLVRTHTNRTKTMAVEEYLEVLSALWQLVGSKLLSQLWNGFERLSFGIHYGMDLMRDAQVVT